MKKKTLLFLMIQAKRYARSRGHFLTDWLTDGEQKAVAVCHHCGREIVLNKAPAAGQAHISGAAVAQWCEEKKARVA